MNGTNGKENIPVCNLNSKLGIHQITPEQPQVLW
jgi:hypothetical protein